MRLNRLETHDRLLHFKEDQSNTIFKGAEDCLKRNPDCLSMQEYFPYVYIFAHPRTSDCGTYQRMLWQPRLSKPLAQPNSYLFRALSKTDLIEIVWLLPPKETWDQFQLDKITESKDVSISIDNFLHRRKELERPHKNDLSEEKIKSILNGIQGFKLIS